MIALSLVVSVYAQPSEFRIEIVRISTTKGLVTGELRLNGTALGNVFENEALKIAPGEYTGVLRYFSGKNFVQGSFGTLGKTGDFLLEVSGVDGRTAILLHSGNAPHHSRGCILLGAAPKNGVLPTEHLLYRLRVAFYGTEAPTSTPNKAITISIH